MDCRHCERQVCVAGLQKPSQHSESIAHMAAAALHMEPRQSPALQVPSQQSLAELQTPPVAAQVAARHRVPAQVEPVQQSEVSTQLWPGLAQVPSPTQRLDRQLFEQHTAEVEHPSPAGAQPHIPLRQARSQQSVWKRHVSPFGLQASRHWPPMQVPSQHSASAPQGWRKAVHSGGG